MRKRNVLVKISIYHLPVLKILYKWYNIRMYVKEGMYGWVKAKFSLLKRVSRARATCVLSW